MTIQTLKPLQKHALAALYACERATRCKGGFAPAANPASPLLISVRTANALHRAGLVTFTPSEFPAYITLSGTGLVVAEQLGELLDMAEGHAA